MKYAQDVLEGSGLPRPDRIVLMSPMIGVTPFAGFARVAMLLHRIPFFEKNAWLDVLPEYNPYKYSSFPANAGLQTYELTRALNAQTARLAVDGRLAGLAPVLTFQSLVDATVSTEAIVHRLYDRLPANGASSSFRRQSGRHARAVSQPARGGARARPQGAGRPQIPSHRRHERAPRHARRRRAVLGPGGRSGETALGLAWPPDVFSLSHVAIRSRDRRPLRAPPEPPPFGLRLGRLGPRGSARFTVPFDQWMRPRGTRIARPRVVAWAVTSSSTR